jgi:hypothetical protein
MELPIGLADELPQLSPVHEGKDAPERGVGGDHGALGPEPLPGSLGAREEIDRMEALLAERQASHDQTEELRDRDLRPFAGFDEFPGPERKRKLVVAETREV